MGTQFMVTGVFPNGSLQSLNAIIHAALGKHLATFLDGRVGRTAEKNDRNRYYGQSGDGFDEFQFALPNVSRCFSLSGR